MLHEQNETFPIVSMRLPSKSLQEQVMKSKHTHEIYRNVQDIFYHRASDLFSSYLQPVQSRHFPTDVIQLCQRVVQQNPVNQRDTTCQVHIKRLSAVWQFEKTSRQSKKSGWTELKLTVKQGSSVLKRSWGIFDGYCYFLGSYKKQKQQQQVEVSAWCVLISSIETQVWNKHKVVEKKT